MAKFTAALLSAALAVFGTVQWSCAQDSAFTAPKGISAHSIGVDDAPRLAELLDQVAVAYELDVSDSVFETLQRLQSEHAEKANGVLKTLAAEAKSANELPEPVRRFQREALGKQLFAERKKASIEFANRRIKLLSTAQVERLRQIDLQHQGAAAFSLPAVVKELSLTADQQRKVDAVVGDFDVKFPDLPAGGSSVEVARIASENASVVDLVKERRAKLEKILTPEQVTKLAALRGVEFDLTLLGPGPKLNLYGATESRISLNNARLLTHNAIRDELALSAAEHEAILVSWRQWEEVRKEKSFSDSKAGSLPVIKNTVAGGLLRKQLLHNLWVREYMKACQTFQNEAGKQLSDEQVARLKQIEWQRSPLEMLLKNAAVLTLNQEQLYSLAASFARHQGRLDTAAEELDLRKKTHAIRETRGAVEKGILKTLTVEQFGRFVAFQGKPVKEEVLNLSYDHQSNWPQDR